MVRIRNLVAVAAGLVGAEGVIALVELMAHRQSVGEGPFVGAVIGYAAGAVTGTFIAATIGGLRTSIVVPILLGILALLNLVAFPHPVWFIPAAVIALTSGWIVGSLLASLLARLLGRNQGTLRNRS